MSDNIKHPFKCKCGKQFKNVRLFPFYCSCKKMNMPPDNQYTAVTGSEVLVGPSSSGTDTTPSQSLLAKGIKVSKAYATWALAGFPKRTQEEQLAIKAICSACPFYDKGKCKKCGCSLTAKIMMKTEKCPIDKW